MSFGKLLFWLLIFILVLIVIANYLNHTYIKAEFNKMDPIPSKMGVYYKGYKLGSTSRLRISKDFKKTYLYITLNQRGLHLPKNIRVKIKKYDNETKYVDIIYPKRPMIRYIRSGDTIKGDTGFIFSGISDINQAHIDDLSEKGGDLLSSAKKTTDSLTEMFDLVTDILGENRENILNSTTSLKNGMKNLEQTTQNMKAMSNKINDGITKQNIQNSTKNIEQMTSNFANSSKDFISITGNFNKTSSDFSVLIPKLSTLIDVVQMNICNVNDIILGLKKTLQQKWGGARIIFGKPIK
ncbi:aBC-type transport system involved in resistance to organic solvents periplasmic component [Fusobacterium sp. CAG:815]|nr:aBC-type transport system involved in resistance to organic solvents periplasmic component [Fusobacterium sp. CAG:815]